MEIKAKSSGLFKVKRDIQNLDVDWIKIIKN